MKRTITLPGNTIELSFLDIDVKEDIFHVHVNANTKFGLKEAYQTLMARLEISPNKKQRILSTMGKFVTSTKKSRDFSGSEDTGQFTTANAVLTDSFISKATFNFFLQIAKPSYPIKFFTEKQAAIDWLHSFDEEALDPAFSKRFSDMLQKKINELPSD